MNIARLEKMAKFLDTLPAENFDICVLRGEGAGCGTVGCIIGWTPSVFPELITTPTDQKAFTADGHQYTSWIDDDGRFDKRFIRYQDPKSREFLDFAGVAELIFDIPALGAVALFLPWEQQRLHADLPVLGENATPKESAALLRALIRLQQRGSLDL